MLLIFQIIGDHRKRDGYEYGGQFYTPAKKCGSFRLGDEWWFVQDSEISQKLDNPVVERISANRALYFFKDF